MNNNIMQLMGALTQNPMQILAQYGLNVPSNINTPEGIIQHLLNTGQINQNAVNQAMSMRNNPMFKGLF